MRHSRKKIYRCICLSAVVFALSGFNETAEQSCEKYKTGKFYIYNKLNKQKINIERKDSLQIETNELTGDMTISKVKWTGLCDYQLFFNYMTPKEVSKDTSAQRIFDVNDAPLQIKILSGTDNYYVFEASKEGFKSLQDTVWLVK